MSHRRFVSMCHEPSCRHPARFVQICTNVLVNVDATSKKRVFEHQRGCCSRTSTPSRAATVTDNLFARERLGSTGLGHAVAIPHGRIKG
jgi:PTS system nitrogen regulatory IIA component